VKDRVILVVDDNTIVRQGTAIALRVVLGFEAEEAADGFAALEKMKTNTFAAILMDCEMPNMDGFQCTAQIRELEKLSGDKIPIIGMTASVAPDIRESCLKAGMNDYLDKSCSNEKLQEVLVKWLPDCSQARNGLLKT
jgi:CheY-like chemotaxis protein